MPARVLLHLLLLASVGLAPTARADVSAAPNSVAAPAPHLSKTAGLTITARVQPAASGAATSRVQLRIAGISDPGGASLRFTTTGPARIVGPRVAAVPGDTVDAREVEVEVATAAGSEESAYLHVFMEHADQSGVTSVALSSRNGSARKSSSARTPMSDASGQRLVVLPAATRP